MRRKWWVGALLLAAAAAGGGYWAFQRPAKAHAAEVTAAASLTFSAGEVIRVTSRVLPRRVEFSGPLVAPSTAVVRAKAAGTLLTLNVAEGSRVRKGQTLGTLDLADLNAKLAERQALGESARAQLVQAERTHVSNQHLAEQQFISSNALETSQAALNSARAQWNAAQAQVETVRIGLREAALVAPIAGIVAKRQVLPGEKVSAEQALLTLVDLATLEMAGSVGTHEVGALTPGMPVQVTVEGDPRPVAGRLARIAPTVDAGSRAVSVAVVIANADERLRAGQFASARVSLPDTAPTLTVPITAVGSASGQEFVWTVESGKLLRRSVTTGRRDTASGQAQVLQGLAPDAPVLATHFDNLREGGLARVAEATPTAAPAATTPAAHPPSAVASATAPAASR